MIRFMDVLKYIGANILVIWAWFAVVAFAVAIFAPYL